MNHSPNIVDADGANFDTVVLEKSHECLVLVDFWAEWCAPCRSLMPILEKLANELDGKLQLVKVNSDQQPDLAGQWGIRSLPTVKLFKDGQVINEFQGAQPESMIRSLLEPHLPRPSDELRSTAHAALQEGDASRALELLQQAAASDPEHLPTQLELADALLLNNKLEGVEQLFQKLPFQYQEEPAVKALMARLSLARAVKSAPAVSDLQQRVESSADDIAARFQLGARLALNENYEAALAAFLGVMQQDRQFDDDAGRRGLLAVFEILGADHPLVQQYRRKMAPLLY